ncbi:hypothetical protein [Ileibacterium valens]|uniref:hypothetical protein n=1 Tax=Ileibacterium valens TaxID=1862668 RepID=UPI00259B17C9|nr:hypothetical protein [Ileibacterium valens]
MIELISQPACVRSKKVKAWFKERTIEYQDIPLYALLLDDELSDQLIALSNPQDLVCESSLPFYLKKSLELHNSQKNRKKEPVSAGEEKDEFSDQNKTDSEQMKKDLIRFRKFLQHNPSLIRRPIIILDQEDLIRYKDQMKLLEQFLGNPQRNLDCKNHCSLYLVCSKTREQIKDNLDRPSFIIRKNPDQRLIQSK